MALEPRNAIKNAKYKSKFPKFLWSFLYFQGLVPVVHS